MKQLECIHTRSYHKLSNFPPTQLVLSLTQLCSEGSKIQSNPVQIKTFSYFYQAILNALKKKEKGTMHATTIIYFTKKNGVSATPLLFFQNFNKSPEDTQKRATFKFSTQRHWPLCTEENCVMFLRRESED